MKRLVCVVLSALFVLLGATQANLAFAGLTTVTRQSSPQTIGSGSAIVFAALNPATSNLASYTLPAFTLYSSCTENLQIKSAAALPVGATVIPLASAPPAYVVGMVVVRTEITVGTKVLSISGTTIKISSPTIAAMATEDITFMGCPYQQYFSVNNAGTLPVTSIGIAQTVTVPAANTIALQWCSTGWSNETTATCAGTINTIMTTSGATASQYINTLIPIVAGGTVRVRAVTNVSTAATTINVIVSTMLDLTKETQNL